MLHKTILVLIAFSPILNVSTGWAQYWQQEVNYTIHVKLDADKKELSGDITVVYANNSPNNLDEIHFHLWPNAFASKESPFAVQAIEDGDVDFRFAKTDEMGSITGIQFTLENGDQPKLKYLNPSKEIASLPISPTLKPGDKITVSTPFKVKIPAAFSRMGYDNQVFMISQWFPKAVVYDANGWNDMPYLDWGEYYDEFGSYDVFITVPANYAVAATGDLQDENEKEWLAERAVKSNNALSTENFDFLDNDSTDSVKTLYFMEKNVHDFAWFTSPRYLVLKELTAINDQGDSVETFAFFTPDKAKEWRDANFYLAQSVKFYSEKVGVYPYKTVTAVSGPLKAGGGMEYPTITVIGETGGDLFRVILHEVGHNWFQGMLGTNERLTPFLDESINSYYENRYFKEQYPDRTEGLLSGELLNNYLQLQYARLGIDQASDLPSGDYSKLNYGTVVYGKAANQFTLLAHFLGEKLLDSAMQNFFGQWHFKHPNLTDLQKSLEQATLTNLNWFFKGMIAENTNSYDFGIGKVGENSFEIKRKGGLIAPVKVTIIDAYDAAIFEKWLLIHGKDTVIPLPSTDFEQIILNNKEPELDIRHHDNYYTTKGFLRKGGNLKIRLFSPINPVHKQVIGVLPVVSYNKPDGVGLGLLFYNSIAPIHRFEYRIMPVISSNQDIIGMADLHFNVKAGRKMIEIGSHFKRYSLFESSTFYNKIEPFVRVKLRPKNPRSSIGQELQYRTVMANLEGTVPNGLASKSVIHEMRYDLSNKNVMTSYDLGIKLRKGNDFSVVSLAASTFIHYSKSEGIRLRVFAGGMLEKSGSSLYNLRMVNYGGVYDYMYDGLLLDREGTSKLLSRQKMDENGGFRFYSTNAFTTNQWLVSGNIDIDIPGKLPLRLFVDLGAMPDINGKLGLFAESGLSLIVAKNILEIYLPFAFSSQIKDYLSNNQLSTFSTLTFKLHLAGLNPFKINDNLEKYL